MSAGFDFDLARHLEYSFHCKGEIELAKRAFRVSARADRGRDDQLELMAGRSRSDLLQRETLPPAMKRRGLTHLHLDVENSRRVLGEEVYQKLLRQLPNLYPRKSS